MKNIQSKLLELAEEVKEQEVKLERLKKLLFEARKNCSHEYPDGSSAMVSGPFVATCEVCLASNW